MSLLDCMYTIFAPRVSISMTNMLKHLVDDHLSLFKELFPNERLLPKHHNLIHYPAAKCKMGPLVHNWTMRSEAKHGYFVKTPTSVNNFTNISLSLTRCHHRLQTLTWHNDFNFNFTTLGPGKLVTWMSLL